MISSTQSTQPMTTEQIVSYIKDLLAKQSNSSRSKKYQYIKDIYDCLKSNVEFVKSHHKFYLILKKNASDLIVQMKNALKEDPTDKEKENIGKTIYSIVTCIHVVDTSI